MRVADLLTGGEVVGRFPGQIVGIGWRPGRSAWKKADEQTLGDQTRTHRATVFHGLGLFGGVKKRRLRGL